MSVYRSTPGLVAEYRQARGVLAGTRWLRTSGAECELCLADRGAGGGAADVRPDESVGIFRRGDNPAGCPCPAGGDHASDVGRGVRRGNVVAVYERTWKLGAAG